ncbi:MAG: diguanylate cyclase [Actinomycetota bacterium]|nr:diguanylate cyclase [Actinomycetota bacterium]
MTRRSLSDAVRLACADHVNRAMRKSSLLGIPASTLLVLILGSSVPAPRRIAFVALVTVTNLLTFAGSCSYLARRQRGEVVRNYWFGPFSTATISLAWGSLAVIALPSARHVDLRAVYLLFVCGSSATYVVGAAARRLYYYTSQVPMLALVMGAFVTSGDRSTVLLGLAIPIYFGVMTSMHHEVHGVVISELQLRERNEEASTRLREANVRLGKQALRDALTGLPNRAAFSEQLERAVALARRDDTMIGVLYFDIDHFKFVNDSLGHRAGDGLLVELAHRVQSVMRGHDMLARLGGDEFTMLLDRLHDGAEAVAIAERVADCFTAAFEVSGRRFNVSASIGIATNLNPADDAEVLLSNADAAQYRAKEGGRNRIEIFDIEFREAIQRRLEDEQELREAIANDEITAWFQPEVELATGRIVGAEALARWAHTTGIREARTFVPLAEESGLVFALDDAIVSKAVEARAALATLGVVDDNFRIWCNVSANQLTRARPTERLAGLLDRSGCDPNLIGIEITETAILPDVAAAAREIAAAKNLGIKVALDDFGTGHSSLTLLRSLPIDKVKIDQTFVRELAGDPRVVAIVRGVINLADELGLDVVAEGVETAEQARLLGELGCNYAQGYLWAHAMPIDDLTRQLRSQLRTGDLAVP